MNRKDELHEFGKTVVCEKLAADGWSGCSPISGHFDIEASKGGKKHLFAIRVRNHTTDQGDIKENDYNLFEGDEIKTAHDQNAIPMWAAVRINASVQIYDVYIGKVAQLVNKKYIPMGSSARFKHEKLGLKVSDPRIKPEWSNVRKKRK